MITFVVAFNTLFFACKNTTPYPRPLSRTKKYQSFINFGLNNYQSPVANT